MATEEVNQLTLVPGYYYKVKNQPASLIYMGVIHHAGRGWWHQFMSTERPEEDCLEINVIDLKLDEVSKLEPPI